jgi:hypothetical protein
MLGKVTNPKNEEVLSRNNPKNETLTVNLLDSNYY